jgi:TRAP-type transport system periplasmic protein
MNRVKLGCFSMLVVGLFSFFGIDCAEPAPIVLKLCDVGPGTDVRGETIKWFAAEVNKRTNGGVKIELFWSDALVKIADGLQALQVGTLDLSIVSSVYYKEKTPMLYILNFPYIAQDYWVGLRTAETLRREDPSLDREMDKWNIKWLFHYSTGMGQVLCKTKPILKTEDFSGLKFRVSDPWTAWYKRWGGVAVFMSVTEWYEALQKGVIDGVHALGVSHTYGYGLFEVAKYMTMADMGTSVGYGLGINKGSWNRLSAEFQKIILQISDEYPDRLARGQIEDRDYRMELAKKNHGVQFFKLTPEQSAKWKAAAMELYEPWLAEREAKGDPARRVVNKMREISARYQKIVDTKGYPWSRK